MALRKRLRRLLARAKTFTRKRDHVVRPQKELTISSHTFWKNYDANMHPTPAERKRIFNPWNGLRQRHPVRVSHSVLGVVRQFKSPGELSTYEENVQRTNHFLTERKFAHFTYQPMQLFFADRQKCRIVERVFPGIDLEQVMELTDGGNTDNYHKKKFLERMKRKHVHMLELERAAEKAYQELLPFYPNIVTDKHISNVIILDYNPKTKRCLLTLVDQEWPRKR